MEITVDEIVAQLRKACAAAGSQSAWAEQHRISATYVSDTLHRRAEPGPQMLRALKVRKRVIFETEPGFWKEPRARRRRA